MSNERYRAHGSGAQPRRPAAPPWTAWLPPTKSSCTNDPWEPFRNCSDVVLFRTYSQVLKTMFLARLLPRAASPSLPRSPETISGKWIQPFRLQLNPSCSNTTRDGGTRCALFEVDSLVPRGPCSFCVCRQREGATSAARVVSGPAYDLTIELGTPKCKAVGNTPCEVRGRVIDIVPHATQGCHLEWSIFEIMYP